MTTSLAESIFFINSIFNRVIYVIFNVTKDLLYLDPQPLMNTYPDPDPGQWNHQIDFKTSFKSRKNLSLNLNIRN